MQLDLAYVTDNLKGDVILGLGFVTAPIYIKKKMWPLKKKITFKDISEKQHRYSEIAEGKEKKLFV